MNPEESNEAFTLLRMISGARYSGVPQSVHVLPLTLLANPKSVTCRMISKLSYEPPQNSSAEERKSYATNIGLSH